MSRIIVKNLPKKITDEQFKSHFAKIGQITETKLKYTKDGKFRNFGFIGFKLEDGAKNAIDYFNNTYIGATKIVVEECKPLNDPTKPRPWSKYSEGSSAYQKKIKKQQKDSNSTSKIEKIKKSKKIDELLGSLKDDDQFKEFVNATKAIKSKDNIWKNDVEFEVSDDKKTAKNDQKVPENMINDTEASQKSIPEADKDEEDFENGRLFIRNLTYDCKEEDLEKLFDKYKPIVEVNMPIDSFSKKPKGFAYVTFMFPEHAIKAFNEFDGTIFQGRNLHIIPAKSKEENNKSENNEKNGDKSFKKKKSEELKKQAGSSHQWNTLFINPNAVANLMSEKYQIDKSEIFNQSKKTSAVVTLAVAETQLVNEMRDFLTKHGVKLDSFSNPSGERSKTVILIKNLAANTTENDLKDLVSKYGETKRLVLPINGVAALVEYKERQEARTAFLKMAYRKFKGVPLYVEWAPVDVFDEEKREIEPKENAETHNENKTENTRDEDNESEDDSPSEPESTVFVKNLNFSTVEKDLKAIFQKIGKCKVTIAKKINSKKETLSMGYGFVEFKKHSHAIEAIKKYQNHLLDDHNLELKLSTRQVSQEPNKTRKKAGKTTPDDDKSTKILIKNIPFEAKLKEIEELFKVFGELKYVRLPKKIDGAHRGFGFVEFVTMNDAKRAFESLCHSTHLFGRRLVLEWAEAEKTQDVEVLRMKEAQLQGPSNKKLKKSRILDDLGKKDEFDGIGEKMDES